jgi:hypothetical protein
MVSCGDSSLIAARHQATGRKGSEGNSQGMGKALVMGATAASVIGLAAAPALAAVTWTVKPGGAGTGTAGTTVVSDATAGQSVSCTSSVAKGTLKKGSGLAGAGIGTLTSLAFKGCNVSGFRNSCATSWRCREARKLGPSRCGAVRVAGGRGFVIIGQRRAGWKVHSCAGVPSVVAGWLWSVRGRVLDWRWSPLPGNPRCCCVRVCQSPVLIWGSGGRHSCSHPQGGLPLQEVAAGMRVLHECVAGIDVHCDAGRTW